MMSVKDTINSELPQILTLKPFVFKKYGKVYYGFNTEQSEYIFNSLKQRDFYFYKYKIKIEDFNNIVCSYDEKIENLNEIIILKDSIISKKDTIILNQVKEFSEKEKKYKNQIRKEKFKSIIGTVGGIAIGVIGTLLIISL